MKVTFLFTVLTLLLTSKSKAFQFRGTTELTTDVETDCTEEDEIKIFRRIDLFMQDAANLFLNDDAFLDDFPDYVDAEVTDVITELPFDQNNRELGTNPRVWGPFTTFGYCMWCPSDNRDRRLGGNGNAEGGGGDGRDGNDRFPRRAFADYVNEELNIRINRFAESDRVDCEAGVNFNAHFEYMGSQE